MKDYQYYEMMNRRFVETLQRANTSEESKAIICNHFNIPREYKAYKDVQINGKTYLLEDLVKLKSVKLRLLLIFFRDEYIFKNFPKSKKNYYSDSSIRSLNKRQIISEIISYRNIEFDRYLSDINAALRYSQGFGGFKDLEKYFKEIRESILEHWNKL